MIPVAALALVTAGCSEAAAPPSASVVSEAAAPAGSTMASSVQIKAT